MSWHPKCQTKKTKKIPMAIIVYALTVIQCLAKLICPNTSEFCVVGKFFHSNFHFFNMLRVVCQRARENEEREREKHAQRNIPDNYLLFRLVSTDY